MSSLSELNHESPPGFPIEVSIGPRFTERHTIMHRIVQSFKMSGGRITVSDHAIQRTLERALRRSRPEDPLTAAEYVSKLFDEADLLACSSSQEENYDVCYIHNKSAQALLIVGLRKGRYDKRTPPTIFSYVRMRRKAAVERARRARK